jgi:hypothetical protein
VAAAHAVRARGNRFADRLLPPRNGSRGPARQKGDGLPAGEADGLTLPAVPCELQAAMRGGLAELPWGG